MSFITYWLPIIVSAAGVFVASAVIWMAFKWHNADFRKIENEDGVREALKGATPGFYLLPYHLDPAELKDPAIQQKYIDGPLAYVTVLKNGIPKMAGNLIGSFAYYLFVGALCAYVLSMSGAAGGEYLDVFRVTCTTAWIAYGVAYVQDSIWFGRPWAITVKNLLDALIYGLVTGGVFGWLA